MNNRLRTIFIPALALTALVMAAVGNQAPAPSANPGAQNPAAAAATPVPKVEGGVRGVPQYGPITIVKAAPTATPVPFAPVDGARSGLRNLSPMTTMVVPGVGTRFEISVPGFVPPAENENQLLPLVARVYSFDNFSLPASGISFNWGTAPLVKAWGTNATSKIISVSQGTSSIVTVTIPVTYPNQLFLLAVSSENDTLGVFRGLHSLQSTP